MHTFDRHVHTQTNERRAWEKGQSKRENSKIPSNKKRCHLNFGILLLYYFQSVNKLKKEKNVNFLDNRLRGIKNGK